MSILVLAFVGFCKLNPTYVPYAIADDIMQKPYLIADGIM